MRAWLLPVGVIVATWLLSSSGAEAATSSTPPTLGPSAQQIKALIQAEALRQGVPVELAWAIADVESGFKNIKAVNGASYGPLQVHKSHLLPGESEEVLLNMAVSIPRGITVLKRYLALAKGNSAQMRVIYFCGPNYTPKSCSPASVAKNQARWAPVAARWGVRAQY